MWPGAANAGGTAKQPFVPILGMKGFSFGAKQACF
jgi:hypothetical protein